MFKTARQTNYTYAKWQKAGGPPELQGQDRLTAAVYSGLSAQAGIAVIAVIALLVLVGLACALSKTPARTLYFFFMGAFRNAYSFGNMLNSATPLILGGLGVSIAMQAGSLNLGGEGQLYSGAFVTAAAALPLAWMGFAGGVIALLAGAFFAGSLAALSGLCKARWNTNELITSFLLSNAVILIVNYLITGPFHDTETSLQSTKKIAAGLRLPVILPPSSLNIALLIALAAAAGVHVFLKRTLLGYEFRMSGANEVFARYGGINTKFNTVLAMFLSGAFYGLAGGLCVLGTYHSAVKEFSAGLGWNGLAAALVAGFNPIGIVPAALFFAWISSGARIAMQNSDVTFEIASVVESVIFFLATSAVLRNLFANKEKRP